MVLHHTYYIQFFLCIYDIYFSWLLYDGENYNMENPGMQSEMGWGDGFCIDFDSSFSQMASSVRYAGAPNGFEFESLNLYQYDNYGGEEKYIVDETPKMDKFGKSVVVTGCDAWTVYE